MSHLTLYRKYRQQLFSDLIGQDHIKAVLMGAIKANKIGHAYLFCGPRGTGKTTIARILAKTINCTNPQNGEPCNLCDHCQQILQDRSVDIIEIDAASNRGIDEIRDLRERVNFPPQSLKKKVYIIDEVHMLTNEAFNALLKTLEEPPAHSIFILATTESHKVPLTIQSRTQRLNFHLGTVEQIISHLKEVSSKEKIPIDDQALRLIALTAEGGFRDALSLLEQVANQAEQITEEVVRQVLGLGEAKAVNQLLQATMANQKDKIIEILDSLNNQGANAYHIHRLLIEELRLSLRASLGLAVDGEVVLGEVQKITSLLENLIEITPNIRTSPLPFLPMEIVLIKSIDQALIPEMVDSEVKPELEPIPLTESKNTQSDLWLKVIEELKSANHSLSQILKTAKIIEFDDSNLKTSVRYRFHADRLMERKNRRLITEAIEKIYGQKLIFSCLVHNDNSLPSKPMVKSNDLSANQSAEDLVSAAKEILG